MNGSMAAIAVALIGIGLVLHYFEKIPRVISGLLYAATIAAAIALSTSMGSVWAFTDHGSGMAVLIVTFLVSSTAFYFMVLRGLKHHHVRANVVSMVFALSTVLTVGGWAHLLTSSKAALASAAGALGATVKGHAAVAPVAVKGHAGAGSPGSHVALIVVALIVIVLVIIFARSHRKARPGGARRPAISG